MNVLKFSSRIDGMATSIFSVMSKLAVENNAVNLGQGFPDFDGPEFIMEQAFKAMKEGKNQYAPMPGIFSLRTAISDMVKEFYNLDYNPETDITVTAGATEALYAVITALLNPGDEVIMFEPVYDAHQADVILAGGVPKYVTLHKPDFGFSSEEFENVITSKTKLIILNNPHNPTGKVYSAEELNFIADIAIKHNLLVISDEVYEFITYDGLKQTPIASLPGMKDRTVTVSSAGKTFSLTGWKIGWTLANADITSAIRSVHQWTAFAVNTPGQHAIAFALNRLGDYLPEFRKMYLRKRDLIYKLTSESAFKPHQSYGSYFMMADIPDISNTDDIQCATALVKKFGVAVIPPSVFYSKSNEGKTMLRLCFAKKDETIISGIEKMKAYF